LERVGIAVEAMVEAELPTLHVAFHRAAAAAAAGASVASLVQHWCRTCFCSCFSDDDHHHGDDDDDANHGSGGGGDGGGVELLLRYALLSTLALGGSQLVLISFVLLRALAPRLIELVATDETAPFVLLAMQATLTLQAAEEPRGAGAGAGGGGGAPPRGMSVTELIESISMLRARYGDWVERQIVL
jgi:hypothetical protein